MVTASVDGKWTVVGSANMDVRSKELNDENVLGILDSTFAQTVEATFLEDLKPARQIGLDEWKKGGVFKRLLERASRAFAEQY